MAQELFPYSEAATTQPKKVLGIRFALENYKELPSQKPRYWSEVKFIYGLSHNLTTSIAFTGSNHHQKSFPNDIPGFFKNHHQKNYPQNPYQFEGIVFGFKYRWLSIDRKQKHLRFAVFGMAAKSFVPHTEAEPHLGDNSGVEGGFIGTLLLKRFAISLSNGYVLPFNYKDTEKKIVFKYGNLAYLNVSLGYRLIPSSYSDYNNLNLNIYLECFNKVYGKAEMMIDGQSHSFEDYKNFDKFIYNGLQSNAYSEIRPSVQLVFYSKTRVDFGVAQPLYSQSYLHFYPLYFIAIQKNIYGKPKKQPVNKNP